LNLGPLFFLFLHFKEVPLASGGGEQTWAAPSKHGTSSLAGSRAGQRGRFFTPISFEFAQYFLSPFVLAAICCPMFGL